MKHGSRISHDLDGASSSGSSPSSKATAGPEAILGAVSPSTRFACDSRGRWHAPPILTRENSVSFLEAGSQPEATLLPSRHRAMSLDICSCHTRMLLASSPQSAQDGPPQRLTQP